MATTTKQRFHTLFKDDPSDDHNKIELFSPLESQQQTEITAFNTISQSNVVPLRKLKQWPRAVICPACRELSLTRVERKICGGTQCNRRLVTWHFSSGTEIHVW
ncbi:hypothetical protein IWW34DRAFT_779812 [Fusarium oxysporum f. sp. albedinis]|uniref:LITAF domain-containing protein n=1 Tax=Fusarium oxysporum (strain Fo5176) TaxID=660025 RepID=F9FSF2_FUSOF|nr:hypothetical protein FOXB_09333 [Fusarium oxysporum f. sp. conglutinans Fo5176]KAI3587779.1 hypothetical protein IWW34DRAFT_779812 [Fusarium oxysporum f. sp. albedinis]